LYQTAGDSFISSVTLGAQYFCTYTFTANDEESFEELKVTAETNFSGFGTEFTTEFEASLSSLMAVSNVTQSWTQNAIGWTGDLPDPSNQTQFTSFVSNWGSQTLLKPDVLDFATQPYTSVPGCPSGFGQISQYLMEYMSPIPGVIDYADTMFVRASTIPH
jgi:MAC/Perforin domain-containing protein